MEEVSSSNRPSVDKPRWDQSTYSGRAKYFFTTTNPLNVFISNKELDGAKDLVDKYKTGAPLPGILMKDVYRAKEMVDSAFHPDTGEKMTLIGRMSAQVPMNMLITGCMITFYKSTPAVIFWQWMNQSFNAVVNYTNRSGSSPISKEELGLSYIGATGGALVTALSLNKFLKSAPSLLQRFVPFSAVAAANSINIPLMRIRELKEGIPVFNERNELLGNSKKAAVQAISLVTFSRIVMASPGMIITPILIERLERKGFLVKYPKLSFPIQLITCGLALTFATPMCCAIFPQKSSIEIRNMEPHIREKAEELKCDEGRAYFNKGL